MSVKILFKGNLQKDGLLTAKLREVENPFSSLLLGFLSVTPGQEMSSTSVRSRRTSPWWKQVSRRTYPKDLLLPSYYEPVGFDFSTN